MHTIAWTQPPSFQGEVDKLTDQNEQVIAEIAAAAQAADVDVGDTDSAKPELFPDSIKLQALQAKASKLPSVRKAFPGFNATAAPPAKKSRAFGASGSASSSGPGNKWSI